MRVRYIGPDCAILAGTYILEGETRDVTPAQLAAAQIDHPDGFAVLDEPAPASLNEPAPPIAPASLNEPAPARAVTPIRRPETRAR